MQYNAGDLVDVSDSRANHIYRARVVESFNEEDGDGTGILELYQNKSIFIDGDEIEPAMEFPFNLETMVLSLCAEAEGTE